MPVRPASESILGAVERTDVREDRLTEVLACVAQVNDALAAALVRMAGLEARPGERYEVGTQRGTPSGRRVDMEIAAYDGLRRTKLVWVEAKHGADYQPNQLVDYATEVRHRVFGERDHGRVLTIIPPAMSEQVDSTPGPDRWVTKTWADVALASERLGRQWGRGSGRSWRQDAMEPAAPSKWRYLAELVQRLEEEEYARMQPLTPEDVIAAHRRLSMGATVEELFKAAVLTIDGVAPGKHSGLKHMRYQTFEPPEGKWFSESFGVAYPEFLFAYEEDWTPNRLGAPAFCAGITFNELSDATRHALTDETWQLSLPEGVTVGGSGKVLRMARTKYLSELVVAGATFDEQARELGLWAHAAISDLMNGVSAPTRQLDARAPGGDEDESELV